MEFLGSIERFFAELYPHRWPILILVFLALTGGAGLGYWRGWHQVLWRHRVGLAIVGTPGLGGSRCHRPVAGAAPVHQHHGE